MTNVDSKLLPSSSIRAVYGPTEWLFPNIEHVWHYGPLPGRLPVQVEVSRLGAATRHQGQLVVVDYCGTLAVATDGHLGECVKEDPIDSVEHLDEEMCDRSRDKQN